MGAKFSPGPWVATANNEVYAICQMFADDPLADGDLVAEVDGCSSPSNAAANARLIAAAPEMYELLTSYLRMGETAKLDVSAAALLARIDGKENA